MVPEGEISVQSLLRNECYIKEIACFPYSILIMLNYTHNKTTSLKVNAEIQALYGSVTLMVEE